MKSQSPGRSETSPSKRLTKEEIAKVAERLVRRPPPPEIHDAVQLSPRITRDKEQIEKSVDRLYAQAVEARKRKLHDAEERHNSDGPKAVVRSHEEIEEGVGRLYTQAVENHRRSLKESRSKFLHSTASRKADVSIADCNKRVYDESLEKKRATRDALIAKYITATDVKSKKMTADEIKASSQRLSEKK
jgi:hypothetical protein